MSDTPTARDAWIEAFAFELCRLWPAAAELAREVAEDAYTEWDGLMTAEEAAADEIRCWKALGEG